MKFLPQLVHDFRYALRGLRQSPSFAVIAVLTLALGIGATSAVFSVLYGVLLQPLPYREPDDLVFVATQFQRLGLDKFWLSGPEYVELQQQASSFADLGAYSVGAVNVDNGERPLRAKTAFVSREIFTALGVDAAHGRSFTLEEDRPGGPDVLVLSHELWKRAFDGDPGIVNTTITIDGAQERVVGIMPEGFDLRSEGIELYFPLRIDPDAVRGRSNHYLFAVGRLASGTSLEQARAEVEVLLGRWRELRATQHSLSLRGHRLALFDLQEEIVAPVRPALGVLSAAVLFVLLVACANVANLLLVRAEARRKEVAVRTSLGAGRRRLLTQFLTEGAVLGILGGAVGVVLGQWGIRTLLAIHPESLPRSAQVGLDPWVMLFTLGLALLTGLIFGLAPALHLTGKSLASALRDGGARSTTDRTRQGLRKALVVLEVAVAVVLVIGAGLLLRSFWNLLDVDLGFESEGVATFEVNLPLIQYPRPGDRTALVDRMVRRLESLPGIERAAAMSGLLPKREVDATVTAFEGVQQVPDGPLHNTDYFQYVTPGFFETLGIRPLRGRLLDRRDAAGALPVAVINQKLADTFYPGEDPVGRRLKPGYGDTPLLTIVGVVPDMKQGGVDADSGTEVFLPFAQTPEAIQSTPADMHLVLNTTRPLKDLAPQIRSEVAELDPSLPVTGLRTLEQVLADSVSRSRFLALLVIVFGASALLLAAVGTYGVLAFQVQERRQELGIRSSFGAQRRDLLFLVLSQGLKLAALGIVLGLALALLLTRLGSSLLFGIHAFDPATFLLVPVTILLVASVACFLPAYRASRVDPMVVLREG